MADIHSTRAHYTSSHHQRAKASIFPFLAYQPPSTTADPQQPNPGLLSRRASATQLPSLKPCRTKRRRRITNNNQKKKERRVCPLFKLLKITKAPGQSKKEILSNQTKSTNQKKRNKEKQNPRRCLGQKKPSPAAGRLSRHNEFRSQVPVQHASFTMPPRFPANRYYF